MVRSTSDLAGQTFDTLVIGSGLGGMTTAAFHVRHGKKVLLLEQHDVPGGFTHSFKRKGYEWDVGVHYVGQVGNEQSPMRKVFDYISDGKIKWESMGDVYDRVRIGQDTYNYVAGVENQVAEWLKSFPNDEEALRGYLKLIRGFPLTSGLFFGERAMPGWLSWLVGGWMRRSFLKKARRTTHEVLSELTDNPRLRAVLAAQCGDYGLPPKRSSFAVHAGVADHYLSGAYYPVGGAPALAKAILEGIRARGGQVRVKAPVAQLMVKNNRAVGVRMENGDEIFARQIVSGVGFRNTYERLWPKEVPRPPAVEQALRDIQPSVSHICLYVGVRKSDAELKLPKCNYWLYASENFDYEFDHNLNEPVFTPPLTYISFPSAKDPEWAAKHPGRATIQVIAPCPYTWVAKWQGTRWMKRGEEYLAFKAAWREALLEKLFEVVPQIRGHVEHCEVSTPLSTQHFSRYAQGEIYGLEHSPQRMTASCLRAHTSLKGLYLTGQDLVMVGVGGALFSGVVTSVATLRKKNVMWSVMRAKFEDRG